MELNNAGDVCILDFSEMVGFIFGSMVRFDDKLTRSDRRRTEKAVADMIDDYIDRNLIWSKNHIVRNLESDISRFWPMIEKHPAPIPVIAELHDMIGDMFSNVMEIPTWRIVYLQFSGTALEIEFGEDFRIKDWMDKFAKKYGSKPISII